MTELPKSGLYVLTDDRKISRDGLADAVAQAIEGGAVMVQYRDKVTNGEIRYQYPTSIRQICADMAIPFIVNDNPQLAKALEADGIHLGEKDASLDAARHLLGKEAIVGISCYNSLEMAVNAQKKGADYVAFGSFYPSRSKPAARRAEKPLLQSARKKLNIPIVAIGGITPANGAELIKAGADMLAVIDGVFGQPDPKRAAEQYAEIFPENSRWSTRGRIRVKTCQPGGRKRGFKIQQ